MRTIKNVWVLMVLCLVGHRAIAQTTISNFDEFITLAEAKSITIKNGAVQLSQAKKAKLAALLGIVEFTGNTSFSYTNNTQLPVNLIPGEVLGGQAGTFKEVKFGVQYNTHLNTWAELKLINPQGWENYKLSKLNIQLTETNNKLALKSLFENSAIIYFNIVTLYEQLKSAKQHLESADSLSAISLNKFQSGLINQQDLNESIINKKSFQEQVNQLAFLIKQQYIAIKLLCDIPDDVEFVIAAKAIEVSKNAVIANNDLQLNNARLNYQTALSNLKKLKYANTPSFSVFGSFSNQQYNTRSTLLDKNVNWIPSSYVGFRLSIPLPTAASYAQVSKAKFDVQLARNQEEKYKIQTVYNNTQLQVEYDKAISQAASNKAIYQLRKDTYDKNFANYKEGVIGFDATVKSFNEMVSSQYTLIASEKAVDLALVKISLNNKIQ